MSMRIARPSCAAFFHRYRPRTPRTRERGPLHQSRCKAIRKGVGVEQSARTSLYSSRLLRAPERLKSQWQRALLGFFLVSYKKTISEFTWLGRGKRDFEGSKAAGPTPATPQRAHLRARAPTAREYTPGGTRRGLRGKAGPRDNPRCRIPTTTFLLSPNQQPLPRPEG